MAKITEINIFGYKSIKDLQQFKLNDLNVLIGANGVGKSNFIGFFRLLNEMYEQNLQAFVQKQGGPDALLHFGRKETSNISATIKFDANGYAFRLDPTNDNRLIFFDEEAQFYGKLFGPTNQWEKIGHSGKEESLLKEHKGKFAPYARSALASWRIYHFHDTGETAKVKRKCASNDNLTLKADAENLAPYLHMLKQKYPAAYKNIVSTIQLVAPFFGDFVLRDDEFIELEWMQKGMPNTPFKAHLLSDGTLRFICLCTLLLQPSQLLPDTILIDEPELGLHPYAIAILADIFKQVAETKQLIISTQSVELINHLEPEDVIVVEQEENVSTFKRLSQSELEGWLEDYQLGELWTRNIIGGGPNAKVEVIIFAEGQSEEQFIKTMIAPALRPLNIFVKPQLMGGHGGNITYARLSDYASKALRTPTIFLSTLFDYYGLGQDFPQQEQAANLPCVYDKVKYLECAMHTQITQKVKCRPDRFIPYIQPYELEGLFFSDVAQLCSVEAGWQKSALTLTQVRNDFETPEHINNSVTTAPSKRLADILQPKYHKTRHAPLIAQAITLGKIEQECQHFREWLNKLRALAPLNM